MGLLRTLLRRTLRRLRQWLQEGEDPASASIPFDNRSNWISPTFWRLTRQDPVMSMRSHYVWGVLQGAALARVLDIPRITLIEFGVAGGAGLLAMERAAEAVEAMLDLRVDVYGFDSGVGLPKTQDYRDCPNLWLEGQFPMDRAALEKRLRRAQLRIGPVAATVPEFLASESAPVAFVSIDLDLYSSTREALRLFEAPHARLLPRVVCYFDDIVGLTFSDYNGERLAIAEFNQAHELRKLSPQYGLRYEVPTTTDAWPDLFYFLHIFDHPLYGRPDQMRKPLIIDAEGRVRDYRSPAA